MHSIAIIAQKGGTGKTTLSLSLAVAAARAGRRAVVVDLDPQATASSWNDLRTGEAAENPVVIDAKPARLASVLQHAEEGGADLLIIDTAARNDDSALVAARAADLVLIPCRPQAFDLLTIPNTRDILRVAGDTPALAILNAVPAQGKRQHEARELLDGLGVPVCPHTIGQRAAFGDAAALGKTPSEYDASGKAAEEIGQVYKYVTKLLSHLETSAQDRHEQTAAKARSQKTARR